MPLVRLGLLERADGAPERLLVSARGRASWWLFLERGGQYPEDLTSFDSGQHAGVLTCLAEDAALAPAEPIA